MKTKSILMAASVLFAFEAITASAANPAIHDVATALDKAKAGNKMLFIQYGREACGNCQALKGMVKSGRVRLSPEKFVYADVNCDDPATRRAFGSKFRVSGNTLPFVVIAAPDGTQLASHTGYGTDADFNKLIQQAARAVKSKGGTP